MPKNLLIDGIKFNLWVPNLEEEEFNPKIKEHSKEIFGKETVLFDISPRLKSEASIGSEPDGIVIDPVNAKLYIIEAELSKHDPYKHINDQLTRFINGLDSLATKNMIVDALNDEIEANKDLEGYFKEKVGENLHKWLSKLLSKPPTIVVVIEEKTPEVVEACKILTRSYDTRILEFQTFQREDAPTVHAHLFDTLYELEPAREGGKTQVQTLPQKLTQPRTSSTIIDVFMKYKGEKYPAQFDTIRENIIYQGKEEKPSTAASKITNSNINGWKIWKFIDAQGKVRLIDELRTHRKQDIG